MSSNSLSMINEKKKLIYFLSDIFPPLDFLEIKYCNILFSISYERKLKTINFTQNNKQEISVNQMTSSLSNSSPMNTKITFIPPQRPSMKVSGLTQECLTNLRRGRSPNKMHLLGFMSQYIEQDEQITVPEVQQLCCYDRMKKLLMKNEDTKQEKKEHQKTLLKAMHIEAKMNLLQKDLHEKVVSGGKSKTINMGKGNNSSMVNLGHSNSSYNNSAVANTPNNARSSSLLKKAVPNPFKPNMLQKLRQRGYQKFFQFEKIKKESNLQKMRLMMGQQVQSKFNKVIEQKDTGKRKLMEQNKLLERRILQKNLQLQTLRQQNIYLKENVKQLQEKLFGANSQIQSAFLIKSYEKWLSEYKEHFGELSISQLSRYIQQMKTSCLERFNQIENKKDAKMEEMNYINENKYAKLRKEMEKLEERENELIDVNKNLKLNREISQLQINQLLRSKSQLFHLRQVIVSIYCQWYERRTQNQKQLMKSLNKLKQNYSYEEMLNYILFYDNKLSTNDKLNQYILKILRGIQKIRKTIYPIQSNDKLDPFIVLDQITLWVEKQIRHYQMVKETNPNKANINRKQHAKERLENQSYLHNQHPQ